MPRKVPEFYEKWDDNDKVITRYDGVRVDAKYFETASEGPLEEAKRRNGFAVGHMINHPPAGMKPNVVAFPIDIPAEIANRELVPYENHPVWYFSQETMYDVMLPPNLPFAGVAMFSSAEIEIDEELLFDYNLALDQPLPEWYTPCQNSGLADRLP
uniref:SET domain-containing protein n=1 Tax=Lotharella oceanica TaxID=641309 RepID=A0A7S2U2I2_9EUKA|mmetsp:Transcript_7424/g.14520  ORF Transcript_7424/g.14520 Transcript_7424/m.14520 type:complete len:156 (+) Transcript_7424:258-725(+)|eukprot:CAMPEP_0170194550 /NCGR_PEP_ID=MMETSP0040_2-20121228/59525_1 /TAXON_ID=641309 /ORGANISM="Lotharella oceanica, Strain CCMP622" /LENGTH=155 /DNA_ID=CAMNT_0010443493 /DNA_START=130 /DNA_END=597 /DNA_ORIENTATION=+